MTDIPTPPKPPHPKAAAKGLAGLVKGQNKWVLIAGFTVLVGFAYMAWKRGQGGAEEEETEPLTGDLDDLTSDYGPVAGVAGDYTAPAPTQGSIGGYDSADQMDGAGLFNPDGADREQVVINQYLSAEPVGGFDAIPDAVGGANVTGGGRHPKRDTKRHHGPPPKAGGAKKRTESPAKKAAPRKRNPVKTAVGYVRGGGKKSGGGGGGGHHGGGGGGGHRGGGHGGGGGGHHGGGGGGGGGHKKKKH